MVWGLSGPPPPPFIPLVLCRSGIAVHPFPDFDLFVGSDRGRIGAGRRRPVPFQVRFASASIFCGDRIRRPDRKEGSASLPEWGGVSANLFQVFIQEFHCFETHGRVVQGRFQNPAFPLAGRGAVFHDDLPPFALRLVDDAIADLLCGQWRAKEPFRCRGIAKATVVQNFFGLHTTAVRCLKRRLRVVRRSGFHRYGAAWRDKEIGYIGACGEGGEPTPTKHGHG